MNNNKFADDISYLSNSEQFARLLNYIYSIREQYISDLVNADTDRIHQISGSITAIDELLKICNWDEIKAKFNESI